jgi:hypothetical protein
MRTRLRKREDMVRRLKTKADSICLTADGVVPLDLACPSSLEALLGPAGAAYQHRGIVVATDGSFKRCGSMGTSFVTKDGRLPARSVAVLGQPFSILPELTGIALAIEACPSEEDLTILTDSLRAMLLLHSMQWKDFPLSLYRHSVKQLLLHVVKQINQCGVAGSITRLIKVRAHRGGALNEAADALASRSAAAESDSAMPAGIELDPDAVHFLWKETWVEWDSQVWQDLVQRAAELYLNSILRPKRWRVAAEALPPTLPLTVAWILRPNQGRDSLGRNAISSAYFTHSQYASLRLKDAICDHFRGQTGRRPSVDTDNPDVCINLHFFDDQITLSLDSSGDPLFKRHYRQGSAPAPLNEVQPLISFSLMSRLHLQQGSSDRGKK